MKAKSIKPYTRKWEKEAMELALSFCPPIHPCANCGHPVLQGYCCGYCGSDTPNERRAK